MKVRFKQLHKNAVLPVQTTGNAGMDLTATSFQSIADIQSGEYTYVYETGLAVEIPEGYYGKLVCRSSVSNNTSLFIPHAIGIIDSSYRGPLIVKFKTYSDKPKVYKVGERIAQLIILPYPTIETEWAKELSASKRGEGGFGSTGK